MPAIDSLMQVYCVTTLSSAPPNQKYASAILHANLPINYAFLMAYLAHYVWPSTILFLFLFWLYEF